MDPIVLQVCAVVPLILGLIVRVLLRPGNGPVHWLLAGLLASIASWVTAMGVAAAQGTFGVGGTLALLLASPLPPLYLLTIAFHSRVQAFERNPALSAAACAPFVALALLIATNDRHGLVLRAARSPYLPASTWAGPGFWAFEVWTYGYMFAGLGFLLHTIAVGPTRDDRQRAALIVTATLLPLLAHTASLFAWLPFGFPVTPAALGLTALLVVVGIDRLALLDSSPVVPRDVVEALHDGLVLADAAGVVIDANRAGERLVGAPREELRGLPLDELVATLRGESAGDLALDEGAEVEIETRDGRRLELRAGAVHAHAGQPAGRFLVLRDRTDQWRQERTLQQRQRLESVGVLAAGVAHEVNNPLAFVRANLVHLQELSSRLPKAVASSVDEEAHELLELPDVLGESLQGLDRIGRIVESLLRFARPPSERRREVSLNQVANEALRFAALHRGRTVRVDTDFDAELPGVDASEDRLVQVALNLVLNAKQALADRTDGWIRLETAQEGATVVLRVRDNGPGVPPSLRERIFDPFFTTREPGEGTGLGLAIAFDILREHDGSLELDSQPGSGACFTVRLPLRRAAAAGLAGPRAAKAPRP